jgi:putative ABC transport system substrate-binding protein
MRRRDFIAALGGAAVWPPAARAQQPAIPVIGFLETGSAQPVAHLIAAFRKGLSEAGYVEDRNLRAEYRFAEGQVDRLPALAAELVRRQAAVIITPGSTPGAQAARAATSTIPIVFSMGGDPVALGLVASLNRPGGNLTGVTFIAVELVPKRLGLLHELLPQAIRLAVLIDSKSPYAESIVGDVQAAARAFGQQFDVLYAGDIREIDAAFANFVRKRGEALLVSPSPLFLSRRIQLATLCSRHAIPVVFPQRDYAEAGGLMSYGGSYTEEYRLVGHYTGRVLNGEKPADMPIMRPTKFELVINLQTARALGLDIPATLLALADEVIE